MLGIELIIVQDLKKSFLDSGASSLFYSHWLQIFKNEEIKLLDLEEFNPNESIGLNDHFIFIEQYHPLVKIIGLYPDLKYHYGFHDWIFKLQRLRNPWWNIRWIRTMFNEFKLFYRAEQVVHFQSPAFWEKVLNPNIQVIPFRILSDQTNERWIESVYGFKKAIRFVHFGSMNATCNRLGFQHLVEDIWPELQKSYPEIELHVIGNTDRMSDQIRERADGLNIVFHGYIKDWTELLSEEYRVVHLIPWRYNTGIRTRVPETLLAGHEILAYRQCMRAYRNVSKYLHLVHDKRTFIRRIRAIIQEGPERSVLKQEGAFKDIREALTINDV